MNNVFSRLVGSIGLMGVSVAALAGDPQPAAAKPAAPQEPIGFVTGTVIGAFAGGPVGAVIGAGLGTWLGNRVHRASDATKAEVKLAALQTEKSALLSEKTELAEANRGLTAKLEDLSHRVQSAPSARQDGSDMLDGMQADVLFRTGSAEITPAIAHQIQVLAQAVVKSSALKVRVDGYADPRGTVDTNMRLSQARADAVRDLFLAAGIRDEALEVNAYGKSQSVANDYDGYALERRVRLTLQAQGGAAVAQMGEDE
jgi:outer membrane protein OmpA-like peptidoglycan-associated protein